MERRYDLDWLRVLAFTLLILYHGGMFFVHWDWHIKNNVIYDGLRYPMFFLNRWRMPLLFVISGMGTAFSLGKRTSFQFAKERIIRLFFPLVFGILFIVPPQVYIERIAKAQFFGSYFDFWPFQAFIGSYPEGNTSWHHLWFLPYILLYSLILIPIMVYIRRHPENVLIQISKRLLKHPLGVFIFAIPLLVTEWFLEPLFPVTHGLLDDWFNFTYNFILFFYGFLFINLKTVFFEALKKNYRLYLIIGLIIFPFLFYVAFFMPAYPGRHIIGTLLNVVNTWAWLLATFGLGTVFLNKKSKLIQYCNRAVYPFYILHQTVIIILAYGLMNKDWNLSIKFSLLSLLTFLICWILYEFLIKRIKILRFLFGVKDKKKQTLTSK